MFYGLCNLVIIVILSLCVLWFGILNLTSFFADMQELEKKVKKLADDVVEQAGLVTRSV